MLFSAPTAIFWFAAVCLLTLKIYVSRWFDNLREAVELFLECASSEEVQERIGDELFVTQFEVTVG